jgi:hypothetical protein
MYGFLLDTGPSSTGGPGRRRGLGWRPGGDLDRRIFIAVDECIIDRRNEAVN